MAGCNISLLAMRLSSGASSTFNYANMSYNLHPIFVHFPIALLLFYSLIRIFPWPKKLPATDWRPPRISLLIAGLLGAWLSSLTGEAASEITRHNRAILELHEGTANASIGVYLVLLFAELLYYFRPEWLSAKNGRIFKTAHFLIVNLQAWLAQVWILRLLAFAGALLIALTGLFGGVMVYGVAADPLAAPLLKILGLNF